MNVLALASNAAQAAPGVVPCRTRESELWFSESQTDIDRAQQLCRTCPLQVSCLSGAVARKEPWGVWGGELFEKGEIVAAKKPKGRPRKDADERARAAQERLNERLNERLSGVA